MYHQLIGGWHNKYYSKTLQSIELLKNLGYKYLLLFESRNKKIKFYTIDSIQNFDTIFEHFYEYGDIILFKEKKFNVYNNTIYRIARLII